MSTKCYGVGVIGCGYIWQHGHWEQGLRHIPDEAKVRYVYDVDGGLAGEAARAAGAQAVSDADAIFESDDVDIVTIATPPFARVEYVEKACSAGKHLMLEKPMARTLEDALAIDDAVRGSGVKCFVPFLRALTPVYRDLVESIRRGELGQPHVFVHANLGGPYPWAPLGHWMHNMAKSGGPIFDYSIHYIELARACMGVEATYASYAGAPTTGRVRSDDHAVLVVDYASGAVGEFTKSWALPPELKMSYQTTHVVCREAVAVLGPTSVQIHTPDGVRELTAEKGAMPGRAESYRNLIAAVENDTPLYASEVEGLRTIEVLDAALRSRETGGKRSVRLHG